MPNPASQRQSRDSGRACRYLRHLANVRVSCRVASRDRLAHGRFGITARCGADPLTQIVRIHEVPAPTASTAPLDGDVQSDAGRLTRGDATDTLAVANRERHLVLMVIIFDQTTDCRHWKCRQRRRVSHRHLHGRGWSMARSRECSDIRPRAFDGAR